MSVIDENEKPTYEAPKVLKLGELAVGSICSPLGTSPGGVCEEGSAGGGACATGPGPQGECRTGGSPPPPP